MLVIHMSVQQYQIAHQYCCVALRESKMTETVNPEVNDQLTSEKLFIFLGW